MRNASGVAGSSTGTSRLQAAGLSFDWDGCVLAVAPTLEATVDGIVRSIDPTFPTQVTDG